MPIRRALLSLPILVGALLLPAVIVEPASGTSVESELELRANSTAGLPVASRPTHRNSLPAECPREQVVLIAHRGSGPDTRTSGGQLLSEDTIPAFVAAMRAGADGFETDYWPTRDGLLVSHHDPTLDRMTDGSGVIADLHSHDVRSVRNRSGAPVPTLSEIAEAMLEYGGLQQREIKAGYLFSDEQLRRLLAVGPGRSGTPSTRVLITASQLSTLQRVNRLDAGVQTSLIDRSETGRPRLSALPRWVDVVAIDLESADRGYVEKAHAFGHRVSVRGVNTLSQLRRAAAIGVDNVVTDRPELLAGSCDAAGTAPVSPGGGSGTERS